MGGWRGRLGFFFFTNSGGKNCVGDMIKRLGVMQRFGSRGGGMHTNKQNGSDLLSHVAQNKMCSNLHRDFGGAMDTKPVFRTWSLRLAVPQFADPFFFLCTPRHKPNTSLVTLFILFYCIYFLSLAGRPLRAAPPKTRQEEAR